MTVYEPSGNHARAITVRSLIDDPALGLNVRMVAGVGGLEREIAHPRIQKSGLALVGHMHGIVPSRIQVLGETELSYVESLPQQVQAEAARGLFSLGLACVLVTRGVDPPRPFSEEAEKSGTPLVVCAERSSVAITALHTLLDERLAPRARIHGVLVDVFEVGVLLLGKSGIGKSETALDLVVRGHRLVADDIVHIRAKAQASGAIVYGSGSGIIRHHMEIRGLGIINVKDLFGVAAIRETKKIELVIELVDWDADDEYERLGLDDHTYEILGTPIPWLRVPVRPGRNIATVVEVAARNQLLKLMGHHSAREFQDKLNRAIAEARPDAGFDVDVVE